MRRDALSRRDPNLVALIDRNSLNSWVNWSRPRTRRTTTGSTYYGSTGTGTGGVTHCAQRPIVPKPAQ